MHDLWNYSLIADDLACRHEQHCFENHSILDSIPDKNDSSPAREQCTLIGLSESPDHSLESCLIQGTVVSFGSMDPTSDKAYLFLEPSLPPFRSIVQD